MTVMFAEYFGVPHAVMRLGTWARLKPREQSLYICLLHESERYRTRKLQRTDTQLFTLGGICARSLRDARIKLQEFGLVLCERGRGNVYVYTLCNPETGQPWPGDPGKPIAYLRKTERGPTLDRSRRTASFKKTPEAASGNVGGESEVKPCGVPLKFGSH